MNKKIILGLTTSMLLASSVFAFNGQGDMKKGYSQNIIHHKMIKKSTNNKKSHKVFNMIKMLDLSKDQKVTIRKIMKDNKKQNVNPLDAFTTDSFDKNKFIKLVEEKQTNKIKRQANLIAKVYRVLNSSQKQDLKTIIDMQKIKKRKMMSERNNFHGKTY